MHSHNWDHCAMGITAGGGQIDPGTARRAPSSEGGGKTHRRFVACFFLIRRLCNTISIAQRIASALRDCLVVANTAHTSAFATQS